MVRDQTLARAASRFGGTLFYPDCHFRAVSTDTRSLQQGELFVALRGDRFDGHRFVGEAAKLACGLVVEQVDKQLSLPQWVVADTTRALGQLAQMARDDFTGKLVAITGSSGKTTVKEMTAAILRQMGPALATRGNLNNHIGVPLTLLQLASEHRYAVIEMGTSGRGEIAYLTQIARPDIALVNNVMPAHVAGFGSEQGIAEEKGQIYRGLPADGIAVLNLDQSFVESWRASLPCTDSLTYSLDGQPADFGATNIAADARGCCRFDMQTPAGRVQVQLTLPGRHNIANALAAAACAYAAGASLDQIAIGLAAVAAVKGRMQDRVGIAGARVIDDTYNANPGSMRAAIDFLASLSGRRLLVLGDMAELGDEESKLHTEVGAYAAARGIDQLYAIGPLSKNTVAGFGDRGCHCEDMATLEQRLKKELDGDCVVLVKGSRSAGMERVVDLITKGNF